MLINQEWSTAKKVTYGKNITLQYSQPGFTVKIFNANGNSFEKQILEGKAYEIRASEIMSISHPQIILRSDLHTEIHVHIDCPIF